MRRPPGSTQSRASAASDVYKRQGLPLLGPEVREESLQCRAWLAQTLAQPFEGPTVAVTHFAPSLRSADPRYGLTPGTAGFCNALDHLLPHAGLWLHGHLHTAIDYTVKGLRADGSPWSHRRADPAPVSYTHLTLPTINPA